MVEKLSNKAIERLILYHNIAADYLHKGAEHISSAQIAALLKIDDSQVRKDITSCNIEGKRNVGYNVADLKKSIEQALGFKNRKDVFIIGAGNLGLALAKYNDFQNYGLDVIALFDTDERKVDKQINNKQVFHLSRLENLVKRMKVEIAILTVPAKVAQEVADILVEAKIKYIWNFTTTVLSLPPDIKVCNENLMGSFVNFTKN